MRTFTTIALPKKYTPLIPLLAEIYQKEKQTVKPPFSQDVIVYTLLEALERRGVKFEVKEAA
jgi:hypothetical protein